MSTKWRGQTWADRLRPVIAIALAFLALGVGGHLWHHLSDVDCDNPQRGHGHPCTLCAGLHASVLVEESHSGATPTLSPRQPLLIPETPYAPQTPRSVGAPRGPPLA